MDVSSIHARGTIAAYHEAGHAFYAWYRNGANGANSAGGMAIERSDAGQCHNSLRAWGTFLTKGIDLPDDPAFHAGLNADVETDIAAFLVGPLAEAHYRDVPVSQVLPGSQDATDAQHVLTLWYAAWGKEVTPWQVKTALAFMEAEVHQFLRRRRVWPTIEALAQTLLRDGIVPGPTLDQLCRDHYGAPMPRRKALKGSMLS